MFAQAVPSALTFNCVYSMGRHVSLICSRSAAVLPLYVCHLQHPVTSHRYVYVYSLVRVYPSCPPSPSFTYASFCASNIYVFFEFQQKGSYLFLVCLGEGQYVCVVYYVTEREINDAIFWFYCPARQGDNRANSLPCSITVIIAVH